jgi:hypothetical protein
MKMGNTSVRSVLLASAAIVMLGAPVASAAPPIIHVPSIPALPASVIDSGFSYAVYRTEKPRKADVIEAEASPERHARVPLHDPGGGAAA